MLTALWASRACPPSCKLNIMYMSMKRYYMPAIRPGGLAQLPKKCYYKIFVTGIYTFAQNLIERCGIL